MLLEVLEFTEYNNHKVRDYCTCLAQQVLNCFTPRKYIATNIYYQCSVQGVSERDLGSFLLFHKYDSEVLAASQPYKSMERQCNFFHLSSFVIKTKVVQNVNRMSDR